MAPSWLDTLEEEACRVLPEVFATYYRQGARDGIVAAGARAAWSGRRLVPRVLTDVSVVDLSCVLLGRPYAAPIGVAPTTLQRAADDAGEVATATACAEARVPLVLSSNATAGFEDIAATGVDWWLQAYLTQDRDRSRPMLEAAVRAGARAIVLTVDTPVVATKYDGRTGPVWPHVPDRWLRVNLGDAADEPKARDLGPADIGWLSSVTGLPVVLKGVLDPRDAVRAVDAGASAVWVSNHGGRQFDRAIATADALAEVVAAVDGGAQTYVDGGIGSGLDALTAVADGADAVFLGRLPLYALAVDGIEGVRRLLRELLAEFEEASCLAGCPDLSAIRQLSVR